MSFVLSGQVFSGVQEMSQNSGDTSWKIEFEIVEANAASGTMSGIMSAINVPNTELHVVKTVFAGEIVDGFNYTFVTGWGGASLLDDLRHWERLPGFRELFRDGFRSVMRMIPEPGDVGGPPPLPTFARELNDLGMPYIFLRIKETSFLNAPEDCGLTINGFYYACIDKRNGELRAFYFDPAIKPFQHVHAKAQIGFERRMVAPVAEIA